MPNPKPVKKYTRVLRSNTFLGSCHDPAVAGLNVFLGYNPVGAESKIFNWFMNLPLSVENIFRDLDPAVPESIFFSWVMIPPGSGPKKISGFWSRWGWGKRKIGLVLPSESDSIFFPGSTRPQEYLRMFLFSAKFLWTSDWGRRG